MYETRTGFFCAQSIRFLRTLSISAALVLAAAIFGACVPNQPGNNSAVPASNANINAAASNANSNTETSQADLQNVPVTLPVLDALFADDSFVNEVRKSVQPSDEELDKLKNAARDAVLKLTESGSDDSERSTRASIAKAEKQVNDILGKDKGTKFLNLARTHWSGGESGGVAKPNSVPTDTRIVVNAPAYRMDLFQDGKLVKSYKVGIGYPEFPLPTGLRTAKSIIFNPTWTPPDEPWVKGDFSPGKKVEAGSKQNPLGFIKIPIGLPSLIHGGKDPSRLGNFASHGCVGLTNNLIQDFAGEISKLGGSPLTLDQIKGYEKKRAETTDYDLSQPVRVELRYETIVAEDGKLHIFRDVYEHGTNNEEHLARVLEAYGLSMNDLSADEQNNVKNALKKMAIDALGKPVDEDISNKKPSTSAKVTRNIKGDKEVVVNIAALKGKGYPAPVNINS